MRSWEGELVGHDLIVSMVLESCFRNPSCGGQKGQTGGDDGGDEDADDGLDLERQ